MKYMKRKIYGLLCFAAWAGVMIRFAAIIVISTPLAAMVPMEIPYDPYTAAKEIYWYIPLWLIVFIIWQVSPQKEDWGDGSMSKKQQIAMAKALASKPPQ